MTNEELLAKIGEYFAPIIKDIAQIKKTLLQMQSVDEALKAGQDDIREELAKKADKSDVQRLEKNVQRLEKKQDKNNAYLQDHEERIEKLEEDHHNSHKN